VIAYLPPALLGQRAWLVCSTMACNLTRAAGTLAPPFHAKGATGAFTQEFVSRSRGR